MKGHHQRGYKFYGGAKGEKKKTAFANVVITVCVVVALLVTLSAVWEYHRLDETMPSDVLTAIFGMWGGELLIVALRQIFGSDVTRRKPSPTVETAETEEKSDDSDIFGGSI